MFVGNNWAGTATVVDVRTHQAIKTLNIVPDREQELLSIYTSPDQLAFYLAVQQVIGEGHDQYVDDMFTTRDGRLLVVSRPSFADVVWIDLATGRIVAEQQMDGYRTDHMAVSPNGRRLLVSDSTANTVHEYVMGGVGQEAHRAAVADLRVRRHAPREQLQPQRQEDLPRQHRPRLHAGRLPRARAAAARRGPRRGEGQPVAAGRRPPHLRDRASLGHGQGARRGRLPGDELGGASDGAHAGREDGVPAGLVPARDRGVLLRGRRPDGGRRLHQRQPGRAGHRRREAGDPASRSARRPPRPRARTTSSTPRTTASR